MPNLHPLLIHFPIALLTVSFFLDAIGILRKQSDFNRFAWWALMIGCAGIAGSIVSGILAADAVGSDRIIREHVELHQEAAFVVAGVYSVLLLWRLANRGRLPANRLLYILLSAAGVFTVWLTSLHGGRLVYELGVGVAR